MPRGLSRVLSQVRALASEHEVRFTLKALLELASLGLDAADACDVLAGLKRPDFVERIASRATGEWMYVFRPQVGSIRVYVKVILRRGCLVVSFHEDEGGDDTEGR